MRRRAPACDDSIMSSVLPGAEPFEHAGGPVGVLLCHGFTGSPQTLRPWADYLAGQNLTVSLPRLPGHGTTWQHVARTGSDYWLAHVGPALGHHASPERKQITLEGTISSQAIIRD